MQERVDDIIAKSEKISDIPLVETPEELSEPEIFVEEKPERDQRSGIYVGRILLLEGKTFKVKKVSNKDIVLRLVR